MIRSMTGYGRAQQTVDGRDITVEIRAVNHRFFEFTARVPRMYGYLEEKLKAAVGASVARGKVDVALTILPAREAPVEVEVNRALAGAYLDSLRALGRELMLDDDITLTSFLRLGDLFSVRKEEDSEDAVWAGVNAVLTVALACFVDMRENEGLRLKEDLLGRLDLIERQVQSAEELSPKAVEDYRARLFARLSELLTDRQLDEGRVLTEAALFAEKTDVSEETVRLRSHVAQCRELLALGQPVGRKLDFLVQELNREANTIGSKAQQLEIARLVVDMKSEIEKIREQVQNLE